MTAWKVVTDVTSADGLTRVPFNRHKLLKISFYLDISKMFVTGNSLNVGSLMNEYFGRIPCSHSLHYIGP